MTYPNWLEEAIKKYDPDRDIEESGGLNGIRLADAMMKHKCLETSVANESINNRPREIERNNECKYHDFLDGVERTNGNPDYTTMCSLLTKCFPERFGIDGKQPISRLSKEKVYGIFQGVREYAFKKTK